MKTYLTIHSLPNYPQPTYLIRSLPNYPQPNTAAKEPQPSHRSQVTTASTAVSTLNLETFMLDGWVGGSFRS